MDIIPIAAIAISVIALVVSMLSFRQSRIVHRDNMVERKLTLVARSMAKRGGQHLIMVEIKNPSTQFRIITKISISSKEKIMIREMKEHPGPIYRPLSGEKSDLTTFAPVGDGEFRPTIDRKIEIAGNQSIVLWFEREDSRASLFSAFIRIDSRETHQLNQAAYAENISPIIESPSAK